MAEADDVEEVSSLMNATLERVATTISVLGLELAVEKTEAVYFRRKYKDHVPQIHLMGCAVPISDSMNYLGILLDKDLMFKQHVKEVSAKAMRVANGLSRLMPNIGGPQEARRRLLNSVVHSVLLYGAPVWASVLQYVKASVDTLRSVQRRVLLRNIRAYRTVSHTATNVLASIPPVELLAVERARAYSYRGIRGTEVMDWRQQLRKRTMREWQSELSAATSGEWTRRFLLEVEGWATRKHGSLSFHLTQMLSGHGCFSDS
ncbi:uncharacterized protein LOC126895278 [Daktulosphaira vitifoliae]|uniref:uncharacterized protein LOC126895278 n=1 Tax=Daktulosphaira vitifoliae TaxID=58002 RepID=UPI0021A9ECE6|nr:uncharacterized protein LOC126895278 [Daktulosphaira vitifoliae]